MGVSKEGNDPNRRSWKFLQELFDIEVNIMENSNSAVATQAPAKVKEPTKRELFRAQPLLVMAESNPKKPGSMSHERFENYFKLAKDGKATIAQALAAGVRMDDIMHDSKHGFIVIGAENIKAAAVQKQKQHEEAIAAAKALLAAEAKAGSKQ